MVPRKLIRNLAYGKCIIRCTSHIGNLSKKVGALVLISVLSMFLSCCEKLTAGKQNQAAIPVPHIPPIAVEVNIEELSEELTLAELQALNNERIEVLYDPTTGIPRQINGVFANKKIRSEKDALLSLLGVRSIFKIPQECAYTCVSFDDDRVDLQVYTLNQLYKGLLVDGAQFRVVTMKDGTPFSVSGAYLPIDGVDENPSLSPEIAFKSIPVESKNVTICDVSLVVKWKQNESHLCWKFEARSKHFYVDAHSGELIDVVFTVMS